MESIDNSPHTYPVVDSSKREIRVLWLQPGTYDDPIKGYLLTAKLDLTQYCAVSYRWGDPTDKVTIDVDGNKNFMVTRSAESALRHIRAETHQIILWMDAICIDQQNIEERNRQVMLMQQIYLCAERAYVWLDMTLEANHPSFNKLDNLGEDSTTKDLGDDPDFWLPVTDIAEERYWWRAWIQQEVLFAPRLTIVCRNRRIDGDAIHRFQQLATLRADESGFREYFKWKKQVMLSIDLSGPTRPSVKGNGAMTFRYSNLLYALQRCRTLQATDARDHVYAVLSLVDGNLAASWQIDYRFTVKETYTQVALYCLNQLGTLSFLKIAFSYQRRPGIPSWIPDLSNLPSAVRSSHDSSHEILSCKSGQGPRFSGLISKDRLRLIVHAVRLDKVKIVYPHMPWQDDDVTVEQLQLDYISWLQRPGEILTESQKRESRSETMEKIPESRWLAFLRTMYRTERASDRVFAEKHLDHVKTYLEGMRLMLKKRSVSHMNVTEDNILDNQKEYHGWWREFTWGNHFMVSESGRFGLGPPDALPGDEIWGVLHCASPMIFRKVDGHMQVVGPCYLDDKDVCINDDLRDGLADTARYPLSGVELL